MSATIERLQRTIDTEKSAITRNLGALESKARALLDWREPIRRRPVDAVALALLGGGILALIIGGRRRKDSPTASPERAQPPAPAGARRDTVRGRVVDALTTMAVAKAADILHQIGREGSSRPDGSKHAG